MRILSYQPRVENRQNPGLYYACLVRRERWNRGRVLNCVYGCCCNPGRPVSRVSCARAQKKIDDRHGNLYKYMYAWCVCVCVFFFPLSPIAYGVVPPYAARLQAMRACSVLCIAPFLCAARTNTDTHTSIHAYNDVCVCACARKRTACAGCVCVFVDFGIYVV